MISPRSLVDSATSEVRIGRTVDIGPRVPTLVVRLALGILGVLLSVAESQSVGWLVVCLILTVLSVVNETRLVPWVLMLFLVGTRLPEGNTELSWRFFVLLAGLPLMHSLAALCLQLPLRGWAQLSVFRRPLLRFLSVQVVVQPVSLALLWWLAPGHEGHRGVTLAGVGVIGAVALIGFTALLVRPWMAARR